MPGPIREPSQRLRDVELPDFSVTGTATASFSSPLVSAPALDPSAAPSHRFSATAASVGARPALSIADRAKFAERGFTYHDFSDPNVRLAECARKGIPTEPMKPVHDYETAAGVAIYAERPFDSRDMVIQMMQHVPAEIPIFILSKTTSDLRNLWLEATDAPEYARDEGAIHFVPVHSAGSSDSIPEWLRDHIGQFVRAPDGEPKLVVADYYHNEDFNRSFRSLFRLGQHHKINEFIEFGNSIRMGNHIFLVNSPRMGQSEAADYISLGAEHVHIVPYLKNAAGEDVGIGHADERIFPVSDDEALTDSPVYAEYMRALGFKVQMLPSLIDIPGLEYATYANAKALTAPSGERVAFLPQFAKGVRYRREDETDPKKRAADRELVAALADFDAKAVALYREKGFTVHTYDGYDTANIGRGGLHCHTVMLPQGVLQLEKPGVFTRPGYERIN